MSNAPDQPRKALGKGLSSLLPSNRSTTPAPAPAPVAAPPPAPEPASGPLQVEIDLIDANPLQPRTVFQEERLIELSQSIKENGIIQPLVVRKSGARFQLIAGERRLRASKLAGLVKVPVVVQDFADDRLMEITLIENIQREDLNPIEVAHAFERLAREFSLSHEQIAQRTGKERSTITNMLRLLRLPDPVQVLLAEQRLSMGHARALAGLITTSAQIEIANKTISEGLSVRQVEKLVQKAAHPHIDKEEEKKEEVRIDPNIKAALQELERTLGTRVRLVQRDENRGRLEIEYYSMDDLTRIYESIVGD
ncbi:ParB/RepB/Spo0J family partition protein [Paludibaculum fermentans]|uniref:ParB/RepB/Spo0J family partition protein n=1 Tax=Paludibaculum fermentans TaxID=1473598 RepID=A0A7S7SIM1_PALFE|nr:ParB/RepB/Spo0J family partition protein [Paludibaculum fermentans]QOY85823.1 ParB/RepB/Spo0J family partition protein [Paludibaculum fermentans]